MTFPQLTARRWFLRDCSVGLGAIALNGLLAAEDGRDKPGRSPSSWAERATSNQAPGDER